MKACWRKVALSALLLAIIGIWPALQITSHGVKTDMLSLLPASASLPEADLATRHLADATGNRIFLLVEAPDASGAEAGAVMIARRLSNEPSLDQVLLDVPKPDLTSFREKICASWGRLPRGEDALVERLDRRLNASFPDPLAPPVVSDPFGIAADWLREIPWPMGRLTWDSGRLRTESEGKHGILLLAKMRSGNPTLAEQEAAARACGDAIAAAQDRVKDLKVSRAGAAFHAAAAQSSARRDVDLIGWGSVAGIILLMLGIFRSPRMLWLCSGSILAGVIAATSATYLVFGELHLLTLVFGSSLLGEAADYSIQMTTARMAHPDDRGWSRRITPGLTFALGTSLIGYAASLLVPLPLVRQIAVFATAGIAAAYLYIRILGPSVLEATPVGRAPAVVGEAAKWIGRRIARIRSPHLLAAALLSLGGFATTLSISADDDVRRLIVRPADLVRDEAHILSLSGERPALPFLLLLPRQRTDEAALQTAELAAPRLASLRAAKAIGGWQSLAQLAPSEAAQESSQRALAEAWQSEAAETLPLLHEVGIAAPAAAFPPLRLDDLLGTTGGYPFRALRLETTSGPVHLIRLNGDVDVEAVRGAFSDQPEVHLVDKAGAVSASLGHIRDLWPVWLGLTLSLCYGLLCLRYGASRSALLLLPICLGLSWACPVAALAGAPMTIFSLLALTLVLGVGLNYGIFLIEGGLENASALSGVLASAATTLISFGLLGLASMPALSWLGTTLAAGITISLVASPLALAKSR